jgi:spectinomycin phosphotransferase
MKVEPAINRAIVLTALNDTYGLPNATLTFVPEGEVGVSYVVNTTDGARYFAKLWSNSRIGRVQQARASHIIPLTYELFERGFVRNLPGPIPSVTGQLYTRLGDQVLTLYPYVNGKPLTEMSAPLSIEIAAQIAATMARLHRATGELTSPLPRQSAFAMGFAAEMRQGLTALAAVGSHHRPGQINLRDLLLPRKAELLERLTETEEMALDAARSAAPLVLCHTDMGGNNVLIDATGQVWVLDWDDLILAPAEHDLHQYSGPGFVDFLRLYWQAGGVSALEPQQFAFYLQRRYLADITDWLMRILHENTNDAEDASDLAGIADYCLPALDAFAGQQAAIKRALAAAQT